VGRRYVRLGEGDKVVTACVLRGETSLFLASATGHVIHFTLDEVNILSGAGKGVMGIKLEEGDLCLGGTPVLEKNDLMAVEASDGKPMEFRNSRHDLVGRGGKGFPAVKRKSFVRVIPPPIQLTDWDAVPVNGRQGDKETRKQGDEGPKSLFD
jgi:DNA gyrase subunit A